MHGIFTYIWVIYGVNVGKYSSTMEHLGDDFPEAANIPASFASAREALANALRGNDCLTHLDLSRNDLQRPSGEAGGGCLAGLAMAVAVGSLGNDGQLWNSGKSPF